MSHASSDLWRLTDTIIRLSFAPIEINHKHRISEFISYCIKFDVKLKETINSKDTKIYNYCDMITFVYLDYCQIRILMVKFKR